MTSTNHDEQISFIKAPSESFRDALLFLKTSYPILNNEMLEFYLVRLMDSSIRVDFYYTPDTKDNSSISFVTEKPIAVRYSDAYFAPYHDKIKLMKTLAEQMLWITSTNPSFLTCSKNQIPIEYYKSIGQACYMEAYKHMSHQSMGKEFSDLYRLTGQNFNTITEIVAKAFTTSFAQ